MKAQTNLIFPSRLSIVLLILFSIAVQTYAQSTILKLPTTNNTSSFDITKSDDANIFRMFGDGGFYLGGTFGSGVIPIEGAGTRLMWFPRRAAFRVGRVEGTQWDNINIGSYSTAMGLNTTASGTYSTAMGRNTIAGGLYSTAMGLSTLASGHYSTAMGFSTEASENYSTAMGNNTTASGGSSTAMGFVTTASGGASTATGNNTTASGYSSTAMGTSTTANGNYSTAMGYFVSTNNFTGAFIIGDSSLTITSATAANQMTMRFAGGYRLFTNSIATIGAQLNPNANSWSTISDSTKKENFIYADGEQFLSSLSKLRLGSWNYKTQEEKDHRHYGPMAQEIFHYFGNDEVGTIGNDTTLATADMDGIMMVMLQALEKRTSEHKKAIERISKLEEVISAQGTKLLMQQNLIEEFKNELTEAKQEMKEIITKLQDYKITRLQN